MKTLKILKMFLIALVFSAINFGCVHDDEFSNPPVECFNFTENIKTIADIKALYTGSAIQITEDWILTGYVNSSDESGNIFKYIYIQDDPKNPTQGFTLSVDVTDTYTYFPVGSKIFIKLKGLYIGQFGNVVQLGDLVRNQTTQVIEFGRIPEAKFNAAFFKGCDPLVEIVPKVMTLAELNSNPDLIGALIKIDNVEFDSNLIGEPYAVLEQTVNRTLKDCSTPTPNTIILRNSGFASFYNKYLPTGKGSIIAIFSKFNTDNQLYIRDLNDTADMIHDRCDGTPAPSLDPPADNANIQDIKNVLTGTLSQITQDLNVTATVVGNDDTNNLFRVIYVQDETGGLRVRLNKTGLYLNQKYKIGEKVTIAAKDLYVSLVSGEIHLGALVSGVFGDIPENQIYKYVFDNNENAPLEPTVLTIANSPNLDAHLGKLVRFNDVEFDDASAGQPFAGTSATNRTLRDCNGGTILVRTANQATFASQATPSGKGSLIGVLSVFNGDYQIWVRNPNELDMNGLRCDGSAPPQVIFNEGFTNLSNWIVVSVTGAQVWNIANFGVPAPCAAMNGFANGSNNANEDWLISPEIDLAGKTNCSFSFDAWKNFNGDPIQVFVTTNYAGNPNSTTWTQINANLPTANSVFTNSGPNSLSAYDGQKIRIAFKYTSSTSSGASWEVDNVRVIGD
ncbi:MAG: DUF5689 domain-containing protein [Flavobacteriaceae bacterium]|jgi:hypothetical protein|nr:DUF5689 domain-containing protein [Flavobacteriaceae bacterium]